MAKSGTAAVVLVCTYALVAGSWRERFGAVIYLTAFLIILGFGIASPTYMLVADVLCIPGFFIANWKSRHAWPRWALMGQALSVAIDIGGLTGLLGRWLCLILQSAAGWGVLLALLIGTISYRVERRAQKVAAR